MNVRQQLLDVASEIFKQERGVTWYTQNPSSRKSSFSIHWQAATGYVAFNKVRFHRENGVPAGIVAAQFILQDTDTELILDTARKGGDYEDTFSSGVILPTFEFFLNYHDHEVCQNALEERRRRQAA